MGTDPSLAFGREATAQETDARAVFGQTMGLVAFTLGFFALGAYIGRDLSGTTGLILMLCGLVPLIGLNVAVKRGRQSLAIGLLFAFGLLFGLGLGPTINYYASSDPGVVWQAGIATAGSVAILGAYGYATSRDLSGLYRYAFWALIALIVFGLVLFFVNIPNGNLIYCVLGLAVFSVLTVLDFNRLKRSGIEMAPMLAASIFLDVVNIFLFFLQIFGGGSRN
jgi:FtsH-binding integral membrane protein